jgi:hypothetical protein
MGFKGLIEHDKRLKMLTFERKAKMYSNVFHIFVAAEFHECFNSMAKLPQYKSIPTKLQSGISMSRFLSSRGEHLISFSFARPN